MGKPPPRANGAHLRTRLGVQPSLSEAPSARIGLFGGCRAYQCRPAVLPPSSPIRGVSRVTVSEVGALTRVGVWLAGYRSGFCSE